MGKIVISENISLDGVYQGPTGDEGLAIDAWFDPATSPDTAAWATHTEQEAMGAAALLMGRRTYEYFRTHGWPTRPGSWADRLRELPKYVVTSTPIGDDWANTTVVKADEIDRLRRDVKGEIMVYASGQLVKTLLAAGLADELRLIVHPVVVGAGERLFAEAGPRQALRPLDRKPLGDTLTLLTYRI